MAATDHYKVLGVTPSQKTSDIKLAYYKLAKLYHPDTTNLPGAQAARKFAAIGKAWEVLSNELTRQKYDMELRGTTTTGFRAGFRTQPLKQEWVFTSSQFQWSDDEASDLEQWFSGLGFTASKLRAAFFGNAKPHKKPFRPTLKFTGKAQNVNKFRVGVAKQGRAAWGCNPSKFSHNSKHQTSWKKPKTKRRR